jgi:LacI family transcriptional regulator, galactose operon repressor
MKKPKIIDIARQSGVSASTVSLVLNNKPGVSQETRARVLEVAEELAYPIKSNTASSVNARLSTVGMVVKTDPDSPPQANPFYSKVILGIEDVCRRNGIDLLFATLPVDENNCPVEIPQLLYNEIVGGLLMVGTFVDEVVSSIAARHLPPIILVDGYSTNECYDAVVSDNFRAAYQAVTYLIEKGHQHIGMLGSNVDCYPSLRERRNGYLRAMKENNLSQTYIADFNINRSKGYDETIALLQKYPLITALFCVNDDVGSHAIRAVKTLGKRVPTDVSIISYDDTYIAVNTQPTLTTMHVDTNAMGRAAVHLLTLRIENPESARMTLTIHPRLVERESVSTR